MWHSAQLEKKVEERTQELEESREQYRRIVETAQEGIWTMDTTNNITFVNAKMCELLGYTPEEMIGKSLFTFVDAESQSAAMTHREKYRQGIKHQYEFKFRRKEGSDLYALISAAPLLDDSGEYVGVLDMIADITARRQAEEEILKLNAELEQRVIERTAQLSAVNRELEAFSYSVSHDLRAPLRTLDGFSLALLEDYADRLDDEGQNYLKRIRTGSQRMSEIIEALLNLARISRAELQMKQVNLSEIVRSIETEMIEQHSMRQVEFIVQDGLEVRGDEKMLRVALTNLLNNAWKFTRKQDHPRIEFGLTQHDGKPAYFVRDNGVGFDMVHADKLFGAFQRLHHLTEFEGTGVGLATVARIIHLHGGDIWAHSTLNAGAAFYFTL